VGNDSLTLPFPKLEDVDDSNDHHPSVSSSHIRIETEDMIPDDSDSSQDIADVLGTNQLVLPIVRQIDMH